MNRQLANPLYYLEHFRFALAWVEARYRDLLAADEQAFITRFAALPVPSQALLVRMVIRRGSLFRSSGLDYPEIGCIEAAARPLVALRWLDDESPLSAHELCGLLRKAELALAPALPAWRGKKADLMRMLQQAALAPRPFRAWCPQAGESVFRLLASDICDRLRLLFFGNLRQDWSEFVVSELGILTYEKVPISEQSRAFRERRDVDAALQLHRCAERFELATEQAAAEIPDVLDSLAGEIDAIATGSEWIAGRRTRLLFRIGQHHEQRHDLARAVNVYARCPHPEARMRMLRVFEKSGQSDAAWALAEDLARTVDGETERLQLARIVTRLRRARKLPAVPAPPTAPLPRTTLVLERPPVAQRVELVVRDHLHQADAPVYYVENALVNSLFGLLCWPAIFSAIPGAFFHPFQSGPADLYSIDFMARREQEFDQCLRQLASGRYRDTIMAHYREKAGIQSPFVAWDVLSDALLGHALHCLPPEHLRHWFERIAEDIAGNRSGFPDLIQFWPAQQRYRMIEVKGPGDRLQDSQLRCLGHSHALGMPVEVCHVEWRQPAAPEAG